MSDRTPTQDLPITSGEVEALLKTVGIAVNNLMTKSNRSPHSAFGLAANAELLVMVGIQQKLLTLVTDASVGALTVVAA